MKNSKPLKHAIIFVIFLFLSQFLLSVTFAQSDIPRQTTAYTYERDELITVKFRGTTRFPKMSGEAKIKRTNRTGTQINLSVERMPRPFELGAGYATYVLWAISPDGQIDNLGEIKRRGFFEFDSKISVTTALQNFALLVTAEPHFLVKRPSRAVMLENTTATYANGVALTAYKTVQYFGNSSDYFSDARTPEIAELDYGKTPQTILQAKQALALAQYAGAEKDAPQELKDAQDLTEKAENDWKSGKSDSDIEITARQAISAAVKAEDLAMFHRDAREKRNEKARQDADLRRSEDRYADALQQIENLKFELAREQKNRELAERDSQNYDKQFKNLREENVQLRIELEKSKTELTDLKAKIAKAELEKQDADKKEQEKRDIDERNARIQANVPVLIQSLKGFGTVRQTERGIVLTLPESYWSGNRVSSFSPTSEVKLSGIANLMANYPDYRMLIESHTDSIGNIDELQTLTQERAEAIADKLASFGVTQNRLEAKGFGGSLPIASNSTTISRAKNRRIDLILLPIN